MTVILIRTTILYIIVLFVLRMMGKSELSKLSPFQLVVIFMIAELASIPIESPEVSLISGVVAIFTLLLLQVMFSTLSIKSEHFKNFINGKPSILIDHGVINKKEMQSLRITINDLLEQLRINNAPSISDVNYAILEPNGELSVILKEENKPLTAKDMCITKEKETLPAVIICDGVIYNNALASMGYTEDELRSQLSRVGVSDYKKVFLAFSDELKKLHIYCCNMEGKAIEVVICDHL